MDTLTKDKLAADVAAELSITPRAAADAVQAVCNSLEESIQAGQPVQIRGLFALTPKVTKARMGRNPKTGDAHPIPARRNVKFKLLVKMPAVEGAGE